MTCELCTYSLAQGVDCLPTSSLDTDQLSLWNGTDTPAKFLGNEQQTDGFPICECGKGMSDCSIHPSTPDKWIAFMQDSLAKTLALLESRQAYLREPDQVFTAKSCALLTKYDPDTCSWKTLQQSFLTDSAPYSETWPRWGMTHDGCAYAHPMWERRITETDGGVARFATPNTLDGMPPKSPEALHREATVTRPGRSKPANLRDQVTQMWPTPTGNDAKNSTLPPSQINHDNLPGALLRDGEAAGGKLNPAWVEWLMGWPIGWTGSEHWAMVKSRCKPQSRGDCSGVSE